MRRRWAFEVGLTVDCDPPTSDRFCPDDPLTRGQLAALFVRAGRAFQPV